MLCAQLLSCVRFFAIPWICPWSFPVKNTGMGCRFLLQGLFPTQRLNLHPLHPLYWQVDSFYLLLLLLLSHFSRVRLCATPSLGFSRQEHWSGWPFPSPMHKSESEVAQSCPTRHDPMDCSPPGSSVHGIFQARVLEWGAIAFYLLVKNKKSSHHTGPWSHLGLFYISYHQKN